MSRSVGYILLILVLIALITAGIFLYDKSPKPEPELRHIVLISIDTCRADHLSCYGYERQTTPNIDRLGQDGVLFENVISPVPITLPAHSSMLTGTIPPYHGVRNNIDFKLRDSVVTLAEMLKAKGFATSAVVSAFVLDSQFGLAQGFDSYNDWFRQARSSIFGTERIGQETSEVACNWLDEYKDKKFFLFVHYYDPHDPYEPPEPYATEYADDSYSGEIAYTDHCVGQVIDKLKALGIYDSSLIILAGDHGEMLGEHGEPDHTYFIYQSAIKVPLIIKPPGEKRTVRVTDIAGLVDIVPTVCGAVGIEQPDQLCGRDLSEYFSGSKKVSGTRYLYCESLTPTRLNANSLMGIVTEEYKYIQTTRPELYDLAEDPGETRNLAGDMPQRAKILQDHLKQKLQFFSGNDESKSHAELDDQSRQRLESLGYISGRVNMETAFDRSKDDPKDLIEFHKSYQEFNKLAYAKKYDEAKELCRKLLSERGDIGSLNVFMAIRLMEEKQYAQAIPYYYKLLELNEDPFKAHSNLGTAYHHLDKLDMAIEHYCQALNINPKSYAVCNEVAVALAKQGNPDLSAEYYRRSLELNSRQPKVLSNAANTYSRLGKTRESLLCWEELLELEPDSPEALNGIAWLKCSDLGSDYHDPAGAVEYAKRACELTKFSEPVMLDTLGIAYATKGDIEKAIESCNKAFDLAKQSGDEVLQADILNHLQTIKSMGQSQEVPKR